MNEKGVVYMALGARFVDEACISANTVRRHMPNLPITLFTDALHFDTSLFDQVIHITQSGPTAHRDKLVCMARSPYEHTLFLDTDTYLGNAISEGYALLRHYDMAASLDRGYYDNYPEGTEVPDAFREFNLGVVFYRKSAAMRDALGRALSMYDQLGIRSRGSEQPAFRLVAFGSDLRVAVLSAEYNCRFANSGHISGEVKLLHGRVPKGEYSDRAMAAVLARINQATIPRVFVAGRVYALERNPLPYSRPYFVRRVGRLFPPSLPYNLGRLVDRLWGWVWN